MSTETKHEPNLEEALATIKSIRVLVDESSQFSGTLVFQGTAKIDGIVKGSISGSDILIIGSKAHVEANINVDMLLVLGDAVSGGKVSGTVTATRAIEIRKNTVITATLNAPLIEFEDPHQAIV